MATSPSELSFDKYAFADKVSFPVRARLNRDGSYDTLFRAYTHLSLNVTGENIRKIAMERGRMLLVQFDRTSFLNCANMWQKISKLAVRLSYTLMERLNVEYVRGISFQPEVFRPEAAP